MHIRKLKGILYLALIALCVGCGNKVTEKPKSLESNVVKETPCESNAEPELSSKGESEQAKSTEGQAQGSIGTTGSTELTSTGDITPSKAEKINKDAKAPTPIEISNQMGQSIEVKPSASAPSEVTPNIDGQEKAKPQSKQKATNKSQEKKSEVKSKAQQETVTIAISCETILDHKKEFNQDKLSVLPQDGIILQAEAVELKAGETVFDMLVRTTKKHKIHMEYTGSSMYHTNYIEGIHNIYEFDCGPLSGWMYKVNGVFPNYGCSAYTLQAGDTVEWVYTCDLGKDVGAGEMTQEGESK